MKEETPLLPVFCNRVLESVRCLIFLCEHGLRNPFGPAAMHLLETLDNAYGSTPGLQPRINQLRMELAYSMALTPKPQPERRGPVGNDVAAGSRRRQPTSLAEDDLRKLRERRIKRESDEGLGA